VHSNKIDEKYRDEISDFLVSFYLDLRNLLDNSLQISKFGNIYNGFTRKRCDLMRVKADA